MSNICEYCIYYDLFGCHFYLMNRDIDAIPPCEDVEYDETEKE